MRDDAGAQVARDAEKLLDEHGSLAVQYLVDQIVVAVRTGDDATVDKLDATMRELDRLMEQNNPDQEGQRHQSPG